MVNSELVKLANIAAQKAWLERAKFVPGVTPVPVSGKIYDAEELVAGCEAVLDGSWAGGRWTDAFEAELAKVCGVRYAILVNSGSSANLLALAALTSEELGERRLRLGDEVVTTACGFPTTVNPIVQLGLIPVFVDVKLGTYAPDINTVEYTLNGGACGKLHNRVKGAVFAHTLGNPIFGSNVISAKVGLVEDCCDALGSTIDGAHVGYFSQLRTLSFYPAHQITCGEGGAVLTNSPLLNKLVRSYRDWGRDCWCDPGKDNTCGMRFGWEWANVSGKLFEQQVRDWGVPCLPDGYDHKYVYSRLGYHMAATEMQAAIGLAQLRKLLGFVEARRRNWQQLRDGLADLEEYFILPQATQGSKPSWFGFALTIRPEAPFSRRDIVNYLEARKIGTRPLFGGNLIRQPAYRDVKYRVASDLANSDLVLTSTFWLGVWPGLTEEMLNYVCESIHEFTKR